jgi:hypothetical protein
MDVPYTREELARLPPNALPTRGAYCPKCKNHIPQFAELTNADEHRLRAFESKIEAISELCRIIRCSLLWAQIWVLHPEGQHPEFDASGPPCPHCGQPLRTDRAKQCFHCGADWH